MTISADYAPNIDLGNGTTRAFAVDFPFADPADLDVTLFDVGAGTDIVPGPVLGGSGLYDYTVTGTPNDPGTGIYPNGTVHFNTAPPGNTRVIRARATPEVQEVSLIDNARFPAKAVEGGLDHLELQIQEMDADLSRAVKAPVSDGPVDMTLPPAADRADTVLTFDDAGNIENPGIATGPLEAAIAAFLAGIAGPAPTTAGWAKTLAAAQVLYAAPVVLADGQPMVVACRNAIGDGYGGTFTYKPGDAATVFAQSGLGFVDASGRRWFRQFDGMVSLKWYGAQGNGISDDSAAAQAAFDSMYAIFVPKGTYLVNVTVQQRVKVLGVGSTSSIFKPFNIATAALTLTNTTGDWSMSYLFEALGFTGVAPQTGIAVAFAKTDPALYAPNDELVGRVTFNNCYFSELAKGIQRTFGNIGLYLNRTSFLHCLYGTYNLNAKFGGAVMHAGNFYCKGGETSGCACGHYFNNGNQDGFGAVEFDGHVFEQNSIGLYGYTNSPGMQAGFAFRSYWSEAQGTLWPGGPATVTLDTWTGSTKGSAVYAAHAFIFDGVGANASFRDGGVFSDVFLKATDATVISENDHFEAAAGFGGLPCVVADPSHSRILVSNFSCNEGGANVVGLVTDGFCTQASPAFGSQGAAGRANMIPFRAVISDLNNIVGANNACNNVAGGACDMVGAKTLLASSAVGDGSLYANAAIYSDTLTDSQFCKLTGSDLALSVGWWVWSCDIRSGSNARFLVSDLGANLLASVVPPSDGNWHCYGGIGYLPSGTPGVGLWVGGFAATPGAVNFALRNYQLKKFATRFEAQDFLRSRVYAT